MTPKDVGEMYAALRLGGMSTQLVSDVIEKVCGKGVWARKSNTRDIFIELDRRYFIVENARWEFTLLDVYKEGRISELNAKQLFKTVQGNRYVGGWKLFMNRRATPGSKVTWEEIEVPLCEVVREQGGSSEGVPLVVVCCNRRMWCELFQKSSRPHSKIWRK